jgi:hypothetical protein
MKVLPTQCGIYTTEYQLICHRGGSYSVRAPFIRWQGNTGMLSFKTVPITKFSGQIIDAFNGVGEMTVSEIVYENEEMVNC